MLKELVPRDRILRRALGGFIGFIILCVMIGALAERSRYDGRERGWKELSQIAWQFGLRSPEVDSALQRIGGGSYTPELVALLDPATGKAAAAFPAAAVGKDPEEMAPPSGVRLPSLQVLLNHGHINLRRPDPKQSSGLSRRYRDRVMVSIAPLSPWNEEHIKGERHLRPGEEPENGRHHRLGSAEPPVAYLLVVGDPAALSGFDIATRAIVALGALSFLLYWLSMAWWTFKDVRDHGYRAFAWGLLVLCTNLVGVAVYLIARKDWRECPSCGQGVERTFRHCPSCAHILKPACAKCGLPLQQNWVFCAGCGTPRDAADATE